MGGKIKKVTQQERTKVEEDMDQPFLWFRGPIVNVVDVFDLTTRKMTYHTPKKKNFT
jgi:hypothetical protein